MGAKFFFAWRPENRRCCVMGTWWIVASHIALENQLGVLPLSDIVPSYIVRVQHK